MHWSFGDIVKFGIVSPRNSEYVHIRDSLSTLCGPEFHDYLKISDNQENLRQK